MQRGPDCLSGSQTTAGLVSLDAFARSKDATPSPPRSSHFHPQWCTPRVLVGCLLLTAVTRLRRGRLPPSEGTTTQVGAVGSGTNEIEHFHPAARARLA